MSVTGLVITALSPSYSNLTQNVSYTFRSGH